MVALASCDLWGHFTLVKAEKVFKKLRTLYSTCPVRGGVVANDNSNIVSTVHPQEHAVSFHREANATTHTHTQLRLLAWVQNFVWADSAM